MSDSSDLPFALGRGVVLAVVTWLVLAGRTAGFLLGREPAAVILGPRALPPARREVNEAVGGFADLLVGILTYDLGNSFVLAPGEPALGLVGARLGRPLSIAVVALVVAAAVAAPLVRAARRGWRPRLVRAAGYLGAVSAVGWLGAYLFVADATPLPLFPSGGTQVLLAGVAVGLPLAAAAVRTATRGGAGARDRTGTGDEAVTRDATEPRDRSSDAVIDAWLWGTWLVGAVVTTDVAFGFAGVGSWLAEGLTKGDLPVLATAVVVVSLPLVAASLVREVAWASVGPGSAGEGDQPAAGTVEADGGTASGPGGVLRDDRWLRGGLAAFGALLAVGVVGALVLSPPGPPRSQSALVPATLLARLGAVTLVAGLATVVAAGVGVPLGVVGGATSGPTGSRTRASLVRVVDVATNLPLVVLAVLVLGVGEPGPGLLDADLLVGVVAGLAVASLVLRTTEREVARTGDWRTAAVPAAGVAATGGAVVAFLVAQLSLLGLDLSPAGQLAISTTVPRFAVEAVVPAALPALALLVVGERLRSVDVVG